MFFGLRLQHHGFSAASGGETLRTVRLGGLILSAFLAPGIVSAGAQEAATSKKPAAAAADQGSAAESSAAAPAGAAPFPDLSIPKNADRGTLEKIVATAKRARPTNPEQFRESQTALRDAADALVKLIEDKDDPLRKQAELDSLSSAAALMVNASTESRAELLERMQKHLESRDELSLADVQTGIVVAFYLEMQPQKTPARDAYAMLERRLRDDPREEMQALRASLQANVRRLEMLGNQFALSTKTIDGKPIKTEDFAGKFVIVDFFATWCSPCIAELPQLQKHYEKYHDQGLEVITISIDADRGALDNFLQSHKLPWPVIYDDAEALEDKLQMKFGILSLPTVLLLNKEGNVVSLEARGPELDRLMQRIFEAPTPAAGSENPAASSTTEKPQRTDEPK